MEPKRETITAYVPGELKARFKGFVDEFSKKRFKLSETAACEIALRSFLDTYYPARPGKDTEYTLDNLSQLELDFKLKP